MLSRAQKTNLFWLNAVLGLVLTFIVFLLRHPIAAFYHRPQLTQIVSALSITFVINGLDHTVRGRADAVDALRSAGDAGHLGGGRRLRRLPRHGSERRRLLDVGWAAAHVRCRLSGG